MSNLGKGLYTALITPFSEGKIDYESLEKLLDFQISRGVQAVVLCGTTGESATISHQERIEISKFAIEFCKGRTKILLNSGTNNTEESAEFIKQASNIGLDGFLVVTPYYNKATQEGLFLHFMKIASNTDLPILLYNIPSRTAVDMKDDTVAKLRDNKANIVGLKDSTGDLSRVISLRAKAGKDFLILCGDESTSLAFNLSGGDGVVSVVSNIFPELVIKIQELSLDKENFQKNRETALKLQEHNYKIAKILFLEVNPIPIKYLAFLKGLCKLEYRLPLCEPSREVMEEIKKIAFLC